MDVLRRTKALDAIDHACGQHPLSEVTTGECVAVLLAGVYVGAHSLWRVRERLEPYDLATVMQDPTFDIARFPEERLAKALDDLFAANTDKVMTAIALETVRQFELDTEFLHFDTTTLSFHGAYESEDPFQDMSGMPPVPRVTYGHSKAKRPDLKQVLFGCLSSGDGGIPLMGKVLDGNMSDSLAAAQFFDRVRELARSPKEVCLVADCKGWCGRTLDVVERHRLRLLSRLPRATTLHRDVMAREWKPEQRIERKNPKKPKVIESYEIMGFDVDYAYEIEVVLPDKTTRKENRSCAARAVRVYSTALLKRKLGSLARMREQETRRATKQIREWSAIRYACETDAQRAAHRHVCQYNAVTHDLIATVIRVNGPAKRGRGRPRKIPEPELSQSVHWRIDYTTTPVTEEVSAKRLHEQASFILIRTRYDDWAISDAEMIERYRGQWQLEHGFAWLKSGADINPAFIHTPHRIAALGFVYCLGLIVWNLIQRTVRKHLVQTGTGLPYHRGKPSSNITTRFLFELFPNVQTIELIHPDGRIEKRTLGLDHWQSAAVKALGVKTGAFAPIMPRNNGRNIS